MHPQRTSTAIVLLLATAISSPPTQAQEWLAGPWSKGLWGTPGTNQPVHAAVDWEDDGNALTPPKLVIAGDFWIAGGEQYDRLAIWQFRRWQPLPAGFASPGWVKALAVLTPPPPAIIQTLVAGGDFGVLFWNGAAWIPLGPGGPAFTVEHLYVDPAGTLYAVEDFPPGVGEPPEPANNLWSFAGTWTFLGTVWGGTGRINAITAYNGGIVIAGGFANVGVAPPAGIPAPEIAVYDASGVWSWPNGVFSSTLDCLAVLGGNLYAGGLSGIFRYDGSTWEEIPGGPLGASEMLAFPPVAPTMLIAAGFNILSTHHLAAYDGTDWSLLGEGFNDTSVNMLATHWEWVRSWNNAGTGFVDEEPKLELIVGGGFDRIRRFNFDDELWRGLGGGLDGTVVALAGTNPAPLAFPQNDPPLSEAPHVLYAAGNFESAGGLEVNGVARWRLNQWEPMGAGPFGGGVSSMILHDDQHGGWRIYAAGSFSHMDGIPVDGIARWDEETLSWEQVGDGFPIGFFSPISLAVFDAADGAGPNLYAAGFQGEFARWDGMAWTLLPPLPGIPMHHKLQAAGFQTAQQMFCNIRSATGTIAVWTGSAWEEVGFVPEGGEPSSVAVFDRVGPAPCHLFAGGAILDNGLALSEFNGSDWFDPGDPLIGTVKAMLTISTTPPPVPTPVLVLAGHFNVLGGGYHIIGWNGTVWDPLDGGLLDNGVETLALFDDRITYFGELSRTRVYAGGAFESISFNSGSTVGIGRLTFGPTVFPWSCLPRLTPCVSDIDGNGVVDIVDLSILLAQFGSSGPGLSADLNDDGAVDLNDLARLLADFGMVC